MGLVESEPFHANSQLDAMQYLLFHALIGLRERKRQLQRSKKRRYANNKGISKRQNGKKQYA